VATRKEFEAKPEWRATIKRRKNIAFILEGRGSFAGTLCEYPDDWLSRFGIAPHLEIEIKAAALRAQLEAGQIELLSGALP
jgi:hypothetical protein